LFPKAAAAFTPAARIPRQLSGTLQLRGNLKVRLPYKLLFDWLLLLLHKIFWDAKITPVSSENNQIISIKKYNYIRVQPIEGCTLL